MPGAARGRFAAGRVSGARSRRARARQAEPAASIAAGGKPAGAVRSAAWPGALLALALLLPFLGKAHTIDDVTFLQQAAHVLRDPLHPTAFELVADGHRLRLSSAIVSGPVTAYLMAPAAAFGGAEWIAHLVQLALMLVAIASTVRLALRLGAGPGEARLAGLLLAATPAAIVLATTCMADVPAMAFAVLAIERWLAWRDDGRAPAFAITALALAAAMLSRSTTALLVPLAAGSLLLVRPLRANRLVRDLAPLLAAVLLVALAGVVTADPEARGSGILGTALARFNGIRVRPNLVAFGTHWVLALPFALPLLAVRADRGPRLAQLAGAGLGVALFASSGLPGSAVFTIVTGLGFGALAGEVWAALRSRDPVSVLLAGWLLIALPASGYDQLPSKYLAASAPAAALIVARALARERASGSKAIGWTSVAAASLLALLVIGADARFAGVAREVARDKIAPRVARGERVWAWGNWGFQWYAERAGARSVTWEAPHPSPGDVVVMSAGTTWISPERIVPPGRTIDQRRFFSSFGRIMSAEAGAGFYSNAWGLLPWSPSNGLIEVVTVRRIE